MASVHQSIAPLESKESPTHVKKMLYQRHKTPINTSCLGISNMTMEN